MTVILKLAEQSCGNFTEAAVRQGGETQGPYKSIAVKESSVGSKERLVGDSWGKSDTNAAKKVREV